MSYVGHACVKTGRLYLEVDNVNILITLNLPLHLYQVGLWVLGGVINVDAVTAAIMGLAVLLVTGVVTWKECLAEGVAWDTLTWFAALIAMAGYLNKYGLISWFSETVVKVTSFPFSLLPSTRKIIVMRWQSYI